MSAFSGKKRFDFIKYIELNLLFTSISSFLFPYATYSAAAQGRSTLFPAYPSYSLPCRSPPCRLTNLPSFPAFLAPIYAL